MNSRNIVITESDFDRLSGLVHSRQIQASYGPFTHTLQEELERGKVVPPARVPKGIVTMNSQFTIRDVKSDEEETYALVYPDDACIDDGKLSVLAPLGTALLGAKVGDVVEVQTPSGLRKIKVLDILYQPEAAGDLHL